MEDTSIPGYRLLVTNPDRFGGKPTVRGTRFTVSFILSCLAEGMSVGEIEETYGQFPHEAMPEMMQVASEILDAPNAATRRRRLKRTCDAEEIICPMS